MKYLLIVLMLLITTPAFAKEKIDRYDLKFEISTDTNNHIKTKLKDKFYKSGDAKKIKLKDDLTGWEIVDY